MIVRDRRLLALLGAELVSTTGSQMSAIAIPWFVLVTTGSPTRMSWVAAAEILAMGVFGLLTGRLATRAGARRTLLACDAARAPLTLAIPLLYAAGLLPFPVLLLLVFAIGSFSAPSFGAKASIVPDVVGEDARKVAQANAVFQAANRMTILAGPVIGGVLIGAFGATTVLYVDAASYLVAIALVAAFVPATPPHESESAALEDMFAGARFIWRDRLLRPWLVWNLEIEACWQAIFIALPFLAYAEYGRDAHLVGFLFGGFGAGAIVGSVAAYRVLDRAEPLVVASTGMLVQGLPLVLLCFPAPAWVGVCALFCSGLVNPFVGASASGVSMLRIPRALRQQTSAFSVGASGVVSPAAVVAAGPAFAAWGARPVIAAIVCLQSVGVVFWSAAGFRARAVDSPA